MSVETTDDKFLYYRQLAYKQDKSLFLPTGSMFTHFIVSISITIFFVEKCVSYPKFKRIIALFLISYCKDGVWIVLPGMAL